MRIRLGVLVLTFAVGLAAAATCAAQSPAEVRSALAEMQSWLGRSNEAVAWNAYLRTPDLEAQLAKGNDADEVVVYGILARYSSGQPGVDLPPVAKVREAIAAWHKELKPLPESKLPELAAAAKDKVSPASKANVAAARQELTAVAEQFDAYLRSISTGPAWREALGWDNAAAQIKAEQPDAQGLVATYRALAADKPGLELREFRLARQALRRYLELSTYAADQKSDERTAAVLASVAEDLGEFSKDHDGERARRLGRSLGYLRRHGQAEELVAAARRHYCHPNLYVRASAEFLAAGFEDNVDRVSPVRQVILGTDIHGTGHTVGKVYFSMLPETRRGAFELQLRGTTDTETVGYNGPVQIFSTGVTTLKTTKRVYIDANGLTATPASTEADVDNTINSISANRCGMIGRFIEKTAWKRAGQQEGQAEAIAAERAEAQASREFDSQAAERLAQANERYVRQIRNPLIRRDQLPLVSASTTKEALSLEILQVDQDQLAAPSAPPAIDGDPMLAVRLHESAASNFATAMLAGETLTQAKLEKLFVDNNQPVPEKLKPRPDEPSWSMTFAAVDPVTVDLRDGGFRVTIRGTQYTSGDRSFQAMNISAAYKIERMDVGVKLVRQGDLVISPPGHMPGQPLSAGQISLRRLLTRRFEGLFEPEIKTQGLKLGNKFARLGTLTLSQLTCDNGWATLGWKPQK
jgi:hypothetical protein